MSASSWVGADIICLCIGFWMNLSPRSKTVILSRMSCLELKFTIFLSEPMRPGGFPTVVSTLWIPEGRVRKRLPPPFVLENSPYIHGRERFGIWLGDVDDTWSPNLVVDKRLHGAYNQLLSWDFGVLDPLFVNAEDFVYASDHVTLGDHDVDRTVLPFILWAAIIWTTLGGVISLLGMVRIIIFILPLFIFSLAFVCVALWVLSLLLDGPACGSGCNNFWTLATLRLSRLVLRVSCLVWIFSSKASRPSDSSFVSSKVASSLLSAEKALCSSTTALS